jgi:hypothetical protein
LYQVRSVALSPITVRDALAATVRFGFVPPSTDFCVAAIAFANSSSTAAVFAGSVVSIRRRESSRSLIVFANGINPAISRSCPSYLANSFSSCSR